MTTDPPANPFVAYRHHLDVYRHARRQGLTDGQYLDLVVAADDRLASVDGTGFRVTPLVELALPPASETGGGRGRVLAKVETGNVAGSHKARHLFGLLLWFLVDELVGAGAAGPGATGSRNQAAELAIASCGNAALAAAVVARSSGRRLRVFVPEGANPSIVRRLGQLEATVEICHRQAGQQGDPCLAALRRALDAGARPFTVQGPLCPEVIDGGRTIGLELGDQLDQLGAEPADLYVQIGGGALATAVMDGLGRWRSGRLLPRLHPVQAQAAHPYVAGWTRIAPRLLAHRGLDDPGDDRLRAAVLAPPAGNLGEGAARRQVIAELDRWAELMVPWPSEPQSVASGILDDVTYDWRTVMAHQICSGGWPVTVSEATLHRAAALAGSLVDPPPDETGAAGLAGWLTDAGRGPAQPASADGGWSVVLLTGAARPSEPEVGPPGSRL